MLHTLRQLLLLASLVLVGSGLWMRDRLPGPEALLSSALPEPIQEADPRPPFTVAAGGIDYTVRPLHRYELRGLVVSRHDTSAWWDVVHRDWWKDHLNVADLCVVWGENLESGVYRAMRYTSGTFTCHYGTPDDDVWRRFRNDGISNNHLLAHDPAIVKRLRGVRVGDQIVIRGALAEYSHGGGFSRGTSTRRDDTGNGACETIWVTDAQVLRRANIGWRNAVPIGAAGLLLALALCFVLPPRPVH